MSIFKPFLLIVVVLAIFQPSLLAGPRNTVLSWFDNTNSQSSEDARTLEQACGIIGIWDKADTAGKATAAKALRHIATRQSEYTEDPALRTFLKLAPGAFENGNRAQRHAARTLIRQGCEQA